MSNHADDTLSKETLGLPVFISSSSGTTVTSGNISSQNSSTTNTPTSPSFSSFLSTAFSSSDNNDNKEENNRASIISAKRISKTLGSVLDSWENLCKQATSMLQEEMGETPSRFTDLESGGYHERRRFLNEQEGKTGMVEGWLD